MMDDIEHHCNKVMNEGQIGWAADDWDSYACVRAFFERRRLAANSYGFDTPQKMPAQRKRTLHRVSDESNYISPVGLVVSDV
jgi:hypothetical protein